MTFDAIRDRVETDYARVTEADGPWEILDLPAGASLERINEQFQRFEQVYRAENIQRLDEKTVTRKALQVRKHLNRAVVEAQARSEGDASGLDTGFDETSSVRTVVDPDSEALADIYFKDGITWLYLGDLGAAVNCFERSVEHNPGRGVPIAYLAYARFQRDPGNSDVVREAEESFKTATRLEPRNADLYVLTSRFAIGAGNPRMASDALARLRQLDPKHPDLGELRRLYDELSNQKE